MLSEYEYAQKVMEAAGVAHDKQCNCCACAGCSGLAHCTAVSIYPDPLTSADAFLALWDALEAKGYLVDFDSNRNHYGSQVETCATVWSLEERNEAFWSSQSSTDRKAALVEAAGLALGVSRD